MNSFFQPLEEFIISIWVFSDIEKLCLGMETLCLPPNHCMIAPSFLEHQVNLFTKLPDKMMKTHDKRRNGKVREKLGFGGLYKEMGQGLHCNNCFFLFGPCKSFSR
jgi:hypothetical protein